MRSLILAVPVLLAWLLAPVSASANSGEGCSVRADDMDFGRLDFSTLSVYGSSLRETAIGTIYIDCGPQAEAGNVRIFLSSVDGSATSRSMRRVGGSFLDTLTYVLYQDASYDIAWGDTNASSKSMTIAGNGTTTIRVYGEVFVDLDSLPGGYMDTVTVEVVWY